MSSGMLIHSRSPFPVSAAGWEVSYPIGYDFIRVVDQSGSTTITSHRTVASCIHEPRAKGGLTAMLELFIYPVSAVMKVWHLLLHNAFGVEESMAWTLSLFGLVVTVRGIIAPFSWMQAKTGRLSVLMRPKLRQFEEEYNANPTAETLAHYNNRKKELREEYGYNVAAGCVPALIQIPVFLGLYQVLLRIARPAEGLNAATHEPIGMLSSQDVTSFTASRFGDIPLAAYASLGNEQLAHMGTTAAAVQDFVHPLVLAACLFTFTNMVISVWRNFYSIDHDSPSAIHINRFLIVSIFLAPWAIYSAGTSGPIPVAIILYWVAGNLWTLVQNSIVFAGIRMKYPYDDEYMAFHAERRSAMKQSRSLRFKTTWRKRILRLTSAFSSSAREQLLELNEQRREEKQAARDLQKKKSKAQREYSRQLRDKRKQERLAVDPDSTPGPASDETDASAKAAPGEKPESAGQGAAHHENTGTGQLESTNDDLKQYKGKHATE